MSTRTGRFVHARSLSWRSSRLARAPQRWRWPAEYNVSPKNLVGIREAYLFTLLLYYLPALSTKSPLFRKIRVASPPFPTPLLTQKRHQEGHIE